MVFAIVRWPELKNINQEHIWFQQDFATPHSANEANEFIQEKWSSYFTKWLIGHQGHLI